MNGQLEKENLMDSEIKIETGGDYGVEFPEAEEKISKTLEEEISNLAPDVEKALKIIEKQTKEHEGDLNNHGANEIERKDYDQGVIKIDQKLKEAEHENEEDIRRLKNNDMEVESGRICPKCGNKTNSADKYCIRCGVKFFDTDAGEQKMQGENSGEKMTREEIDKRVKKINEKIDNPWGLTIEDIKALKKERSELLNGLEEYKDGWTKESGDQSLEKSDDLKNPESDMDTESNKDFREKITRELENEESLLSKTMKKVYDVESHIEDLKKGLQELEKMPESERKSHALEIHGASLKNKNKELARLKEIVDKIVERMSEEK